MATPTRDPATGKITGNVPDGEPRPKRKDTRPGARKMSPEWRARVGEGARRGMRAWRDGLVVLSPHIRAYLATGAVHASMRPTVADETALIGLYSNDIAPDGDLTAGQRVWLRKLWRATVALGAATDRLLRTGDLGAFEGLAPLLADERAALGALGLARRSRQVPSLAAYLEARAAETANGADANESADAIDVEPASTAAPDPSPMVGANPIAGAAGDPERKED